jgi:hypothetical protein
MRRLHLLESVVFVLAFLIGFAGFMNARAQEVTAAITGTVTDPSGAPITGGNRQGARYRQRHHLDGGNE